MSDGGGWFDIPGVQKGQRTLAEQMKGLEYGLTLAKDRAVCDLGCAEGLIAMEFRKAGAASVYACDYNAALIDTAKRLTEGWKDITFQHIDLRELIAQEHDGADTWQYDIVLALALIHKFREPRIAVEFCADVAREWVIYRLPERNDGSAVRAKHSTGTVNVLAVMAAKGFNLDRVERGPRKEAVQYWRRRSAEA